KLGRVMRMPRSDERDDRGRQQNQDHHIFELIQKPLKQRPWLFLFQPVLTIALLSLQRLLAAQSAGWIGMQTFDQFFSLRPAVLFVVHTFDPSSSFPFSPMPFA